MFFRVCGGAGHGKLFGRNKKVVELVNFGGLVVSILATGTPSSRVQTRPKPLDFSGVWKILSMPSFGGEVKESVPCPSFVACKKS